MGNTKETFDYEGVKSKMDNLQGKFDEFSSILEKCSEKIFSEINGPESAIFGETATMLKNAWDDNAITFGDFRRNFDSWAQVAAQISMNNLQFEADVIEQFRTTGVGTSVLRDDGQVVKMTDIIDETYAGQVVVEETSSGGWIVARTNVDGSTTKMHYNSNNELLRIEEFSVNDNGQKVTKTIFDGSIKIETETENGKITEYQYDGWCKIQNENGEWAYYQIGDDNQRILVEESVFNEGVANGAANLNSFADGGAYADVVTYDSSKYAGVMDPTTDKIEIKDSVIVDNDSIISDGDSYTMSAGSTLKLADGEKYEFVGVSDKGQLIVKLGDEEFAIDDKGNPVTPEAYTNLDTTVFDVYDKNDGFTITDTVIDDSADISYSTEYIRSGGMEQSGDYSVNISSGDVDGDGVISKDERDYYYDDEQASNVHLGEIGDAILSDKTMIAADGEHFTETDYDNQSFSDILYNQSTDTGISDDTYYSDDNNDGWISTSSESLNSINNGSQDAIDKVNNGDSNSKAWNWDDDAAFVIVEKDSE